MIYTSRSSDKLYNYIILSNRVYCHRERYIDQWNRTVIPEADPKIQGQLVFNNKDNSVQKGHSFQQIVFE